MFQYDGARIPFRIIHPSAFRLCCRCRPLTSSKPKRLYLLFDILTLILGHSKWRAYSRMACDFFWLHNLTDIKKTCLLVAYFAHSLAHMSAVNFQQCFSSSTGFSFTAHHNHHSFSWFKIQICLQLNCTPIFLLCILSNEARQNRIYSNKQGKNGREKGTITVSNSVNGSKHAKKSDWCVQRKKHSSVYRRKYPKQPMETEWVVDTE